MMDNHVLIPHLFRTEYRKLVSVLCRLFGISHIEVAEDIVSDTFLTATETWSLDGVPANPTAWLYTVAKNKTRNQLKRHLLFEQKLAPAVTYETDATDILEIDFSEKHIADSQLAMLFTVCDPAVSTASQIALALNLLCGFGIQEIADAFLTNKEVIYKRINRAKEKLKAAAIKIEQPSLSAIDARLEVVLTTIYLLFSEGYYSTSHHTVLRQEFCAEAMRLCDQLIANRRTATPAVHALMALMCFHASRFDARTGDHGEIILYRDQDDTRWDRALIERGQHYLNTASTGIQVSRYHLEAGIAYWHTQRADTTEKWENILTLYNHLLTIAYSPIAALNRTFALAKVRGKAAAIAEAEKLQLTGNLFYYSLLGNLYTGIDNRQALAYYRAALKAVGTDADREIIQRHITALSSDIQDS
ncbi:DUF6596 domain-containing protein [Parapedobacter lycopersici]|uniref:RNA polymerase sigma factor n=1 Tax=Parapedobacter lycopersici TaxID=1864939 RepID=UPI00333EA194